MAEGDFSFDIAAVSSLDKGVVFSPHLAVRPLGDVIESPSTFNKHVFNDAEHNIKYLVLTNTWRKFVDCSQNSLVGCEEWEMAI